MITNVASLGLSRGDTNSLTVKLNAAQTYLQASDTADAISSLHAFINELQALVNSGRLSSDSAAPLISAAQAIISAL